MIKVDNTLLVCSKSTRAFLSDIKRAMVISSSMDEKEFKKLQNTEEQVIAVGGGAVIDAAKIICKNPIVCYPTTAAGSCYTSHSVYWSDTNKKSIKVPIPKQVIIREKLLESLPVSVLNNTRFDALSHCLDSLWSINKTKKSIKLCYQSLELLKSCESRKQLIEAGNLAGQAINICPTTVLHSLSYPLTSFYQISHGRALGALLKPVCDYMKFDISDYMTEPFLTLPKINCELVAKEAIKYQKIFDTSQKICYTDIVRILNSIIKE